MPRPGIPSQGFAAALPHASAFARKLRRDKRPLKSGWRVQESRKTKRFRSPRRSASRSRRRRPATCRSSSRSFRRTWRHCQEAVRRRAVSRSQSSGRSDRRPIPCCMSGSRPRGPSSPKIAGFQIGGGGGIRTPGTRERTTDFESAAFVHSATPPGRRTAGPIGRARTGMGAMLPRPPEEVKPPYPFPAAVTATPAPCPFGRARRQVCCARPRPPRPAGRACRHPKPS
jgi:hypothetical protein